MSSNWLHNIKHVKAGEPVKAGVVARPDRALADRTEYLRQQLEAGAISRALFDYDALVDSSVLPGQAVFWNKETSQYEPALAAVTTDSETGAFVIQPSADVMGLCFKKKTSTVADIVLYGAVKLPELTNAIAGDITAGRYYLSPTTPGGLTAQQPPATVAVCFVLGTRDACADDPWVVVAPQIREFLENHTHYRFELVCLPAGDHDPVAAVEDEIHTITDANSDLPGWLPADNAIFQTDPDDVLTNFAPAGAKFGYNLSQHPELQQLWPPIPLTAVAMLWDKGYDQVGATEVDTRSAEPLCLLDANGIWWMSDCYGEVPWPADLDTAAVVETSESSEYECPRQETMRIILSYVRLLFGNNRGYVTSLQPAEGSPITVQNCDGADAITGDLYLNLALEFLLDPEEVTGAQVFKELADGYKFKRGWVAEGAIAGAGPIVIEGTHERALTTTEKAALGLDEEDTTTLQQGILTVSYDDELVEREISPQIIRLSDTVERLYQDIPYLGFPKSQDSLMRVRLNVPAANLGTSLNMKIRVQLFGRTTGVLPDMVMTYRRITRPPEGGVALPTSDTALTFTMPGDSLAVDTAIEVESDAFEIAEGDTVLVTLERLGSSDGYLAEVGLLRLTGVIGVTT